MDQAILAGRVELRPVRRQFNAVRWAGAVGSSGTIKAIERVAVANGWCNEGISKSALKKIRRTLRAFSHIDEVRLEGLSDDRRPVFAGGVAVLSAVFKALDIEHMQVSQLALREGLLYEMLGHIRHVDVRETTVKALMQRFTVDQKQATQVERTALALLSQVRAPWALDDPEYERMLAWAAGLHEIGLVIAHGSFHKHGAYILANADMPGFSREQQALLAALVRVHRRKFVDAEFENLPEAARLSARRLAVLLRLSVMMHRGRSGSHKPPLRIIADDAQLQLTFPAQWLAEHPLTEAELSREASYVGNAGFSLQYA
jgi:exopolyphosphatase/guanosine-5'-triphosphate,3'-diphosphate pyrophosphatase